MHRDTLSELGSSFLEKERYWGLKRKKEPEARIAEACGAGALSLEYQKERQCRIEARPYIELDRVQDGAIQALEHLGQTYEQVLVTLRHDTENLIWQLHHQDLTRHFSAVLSSGEVSDPRWKLKYGLVSEHLKQHPGRAARHVLITDTDTDVRSGKELGFATIAITNGIRERSILEAAHPDRIIDRTSELLERAVLELLESS